MSICLSVVSVPKAKNRKRKKKRFTHSTPQTALLCQSKLFDLLPQMKRRKRGKNHFISPRFVVSQFGVIFKQANTHIHTHVHVCAIACVSNLSYSLSVINVGSVIIFLEKKYIFTPMNVYSFEEKKMIQFERYTGGILIGNNFQTSRTHTGTQ